MKLPWKFILLSFLIGLLLGGAGGMMHGRRMAREWMRNSPERFLKHLNREVHLSGAQSDQIQTLLNVDRNTLSAYQDNLRKTTRAQIRALLNPDQQTRFDAMVARHDARRKQREGR